MNKCISDYILIPNGIEQLRREIQSFRKPMFKRLYEQCRWYTKQYLPEEHPAKSITYMGMAAANLSLVYRLTEQQHYLDEAKRWIFAGVNYPHWGKVVHVDVDLSASWLLFGYGLSYNWISHFLEPEEKRRLKDKLILQGTRMYEYAVQTRGKGWSTEYWQNHNWINLTGLAVAAYAIVDEYSEAQAWIDHARENFKLVASLMADDGSDYEGVAYWRYGVLWLLIYADVLRDREGINLFKEFPFLQNTFYYRLYQSAPNLEEVINFGDCHDRKSGHSVAMYYKFASEYHIGHAQWLAKWVAENALFREAYESGIKPGIMPEAFLELLWYDPTVEPTAPDDLPTTRYFEDLGLVVIRSGWDMDAIHFSFKSGAPGGRKQWENSWEIDKRNGWETRGLSHQHPDNNSFILVGHDAYLAIDEGYNRTMKACEHNTIIVDGKGYQEEDNNNVYRNTPYDAQAVIEEYANEHGYVYTIGEASKLYASDLELQRFTRNVLYTGSDYFVIVDELESTKPHIYTWLLHSDTCAQKVSDRIYRVVNGPGKLDIYTVEPQKHIVRQVDTNVKAIMTTQEPDNFREQKMKTLCIENEQPVKNIRMMHILRASGIFDEKEWKLMQVNNEQCSGVEISSDGFKEIVLWNKGEQMEWGNIVSDARWVSLRYRQGNLVKYAMYQGTYIKMDHDMLVKKHEKQNIFYSIA